MDIRCLLNALRKVSECFTFYDTGFVRWSFCMSSESCTTQYFCMNRIYIATRQYQTGIFIGNL
jgi:hypothetical protein